MLPPHRRMLKRDQVQSVFRWLVSITILLALGTPTVTRNLSHNAFLALGILGLGYWILQPRKTTYTVRKLPWLVIVAILAPLVSVGATLAAQPVVTAYDIDLLQFHIYYGVALLSYTAIACAKPSPHVFWGGLLLCLILSTASALVQMLEHGLFYRVGDARSNPILFADIALAAGFMLAAGHTFSATMGRLRNLIVCFALALGIFCAAAAQTRGALIFIPVGLALLLIFRGRSNSNWRAMAIIVALVIVALLPFSSRLSQRTEVGWNHFEAYIEEPVPATENSVSARLEMWKAAWKAFQKEPFFGIGSGHFAELQKKLAAAGQIDLWIVDALDGKPHTHAHNIFMTTLATRGALGLGALTLFLVIPAIYLQKRRDRDRYGFANAGIILTVAYVCFGLTDSVLFHWQTLDFYLISMSTVLGYSTFTPNGEVAS